MRGVSVLFVVGICLRWGSAQYLNNRPFPTYSLQNMPDTEFSCRDKILGGYYADADTQCQMFHICVKVAGVGVQDFRFLCPNGTAFDQDHQICADWEDVDCDATTLYYSSDNFDLYRIGSGYESKAVKYGEDEETFALQRAETGDVRLNKEHQVQRVNQHKDAPKQYYRSNNKPRPQQDNNQEKDIFKGSSSSNFFNNRNNGKENDEDYDDGNVNINQERDNYQRKKIIRKQNRRPANQENSNNNNNNRQNEPTRNYEPTRNIEQPKTQHPRNRYQNNNRQYNNNNNNNNNNYNNNNDNNQENHDTQTSRTRPTGFRNNFAGSSYIPTTSRPSSTTLNTEQYTTAVNNYRFRNGQRANENKQYNNAENFRQTQDSNPPTPTYAVSTPAPFRHTQQYNNAPQRQQTNYNSGQYNPTTQPPKKHTDNYPTTTTAKPNYPSETPVRNTQVYYNPQYDVPKTKQTENYPSTPITKQTENYPTSNNKQTTAFKTENYPSNNPKFTNFDNKKQTTPLKQTENYPTTYAPKTIKIDQTPTQYTNNQKPTDNFPTTFAPRTNAQYTQISQQTTQYKNTNPDNFSSQSTQHFNPPVPTNQYNSQQPRQQNSTPKTSPFTQYTPTVPKITSTTPVSRTVQRSSRFDETQYDDGSYDSRYNNKEEESLNTAHSQNIASSRNEYNNKNKNNNNNNRPTKPSQVTHKPYYESPRPFSVSPNTPKSTDYPRSSTKNVQVQKPVENKKPLATKPTKKDYDYAYYDTNVGSEQEYEIDTDIKKSTVTN